MSPEQLRLRDEILQVLFWLQGEGLEDQAHLDGLAMFIGHASETLEPVLALLGRDGLIAGPAPETARFALTELGIREGGRRFIDNFEDTGLGLAKACAPGCDCETLGPDHCGHG